MTIDVVTSPLAIDGGKPLRDRPWPPWPRPAATTVNALEQAARSGDWAISGLSRGEAGLNADQRFAQQFGAYLGCPFVIPCDHGSSALVMALEALGIGRGDEVIVPGLTWVACATAVERVNAEPVLVDVSAETLCLSPGAVEQAISSRTAAILVVHLYSAMADMDALRAIADRHGLFLIEDSAQAHGAEWRGRKAGTLGDIGTFSFQQGKVLTCGEGGAAVTEDPRLASLLERTRSDGRRYRSDRPAEGRMQLAEVGGSPGRNYGLSGLQLAVLSSALEELDEQNRQRAANGDFLTGALDQEIDGLECVQPHSQNNFRVFYHFPVRFHPEAFAQRSAEVLGAALTKELGTWVHPPYPPLSRHPLLAVRRSRRFSARGSSLPTVPAGLPEAERQVRRTLLFHHSCLLGTRQDMEDIVAAFRKVQSNAKDLPRSLAPPQEEAHEEGGAGGRS